MSKQMQVNSDEFKKNEQVSTDVFKALKAKLSDRDLDVMRRANQAFINISNDSMDRFNFNGSGGAYGIAGVGTQEFVLNKLIELSNLGQDTFTFLDIGAGYHGCGRDIAKYINENQALFPNIKHVEIVSLSGDDSDAHQYDVGIGICRVSEISRFKIEEIGRWINPSDEMIKAYETIIENNDDYTKLVHRYTPVRDKNCVNT